MARIREDVVVTVVARQPTGQLLLLDKGEARGLSFPVLKTEIACHEGSRHAVYVATEQTSQDITEWLAQQGLRQQSDDKSSTLET